MAEPAQMITTTQKALMTIDEVAARLSVGRSTVRRMIESGDLPALCLRSGRRKQTLRIRSEALERWLVALERQSARKARESASQDEESRACGV